MSVVIDPAATAATPRTDRWVDRIDRWCARVGDRVNPILVKETRQALKSQQFLITFSLLLIASFGWTVVGSMLRMPQIYTSPTAPFMLVGYYLVLAVPMLLVVPLAAYRSLEAEIDDGTLELLSITVLSPWQIVMGKLASATLQMMLYFVALFPCVAYAYTLRGIDLPTLMIVMGCLFMGGLLLTVIALSVAPLSRSRSGRVLTLLGVLGTLLLGEYVIGAICIQMILYGIIATTKVVWYTIFAAVLFSVTMANLLLTTTSMMLTPESENRSTAIRWALMRLTAVMIGLGGFSLARMGEETIVYLSILAVTLVPLWLIAASMMTAESNFMTPRIRRELPSSYIARMSLTYLMPGPAAGLTFGVVGLVSVLACFYLAVLSLRSFPPGSGLPGNVPDMLQEFIVVLGAYAVIFLVLTRGLIALIQRHQNVRVEVGLAAMVAVAGMSALVPYSIAIYLFESMKFDYSVFQITNWAWTMSEVVDARLNPLIRYGLVVTAMVLFLASLLISSAVTLPRKIAVPTRVRDELSATR